MIRVRVSLPRRRLGRLGKLQELNGKFRCQPAFSPLIYPSKIGKIEGLEENHTLNFLVSKWLKILPRITPRKASRF